MLRFFLWIGVGSLSLQCQSKATSTESLPFLKNANSDTITLVTDTLPTPYNLAYLMGKFNPTNHPDFVLIDKQYANRDGMYLHKEAYQAFQKMYQAALQDGVQLIIISATRNFESQKSIWEAKWKGERLVESGENLAKTTPDPKERAFKILRYSSMPSSSRHHWGTDMDLNNLTNEYFEHGQGKKIYDWLQANAGKYGFCQPYTPKGELRPHGYEEEKWHWSYLPIAKPLTDLAARHFKDELIAGFLGADQATSIGIVKHYVLGINAACL